MLTLEELAEYLDIVRERFTYKQCRSKRAYLAGVLETLVEQGHITEHMKNRALFWHVEWAA